MNRLKVSLYALLVVLLAVAQALVAGRFLTRRAIEDADARLADAVALVDAHAQIVSAEAAQLAGTVAQVPAVVQAATSGGDVGAAAHAAVVALASSGPQAAQPPLVVAFTPSNVIQRVAGGEPAPGPDPSAVALVAAVAADGAPRDVHLFLDGALYFLAAARVVPGVAVAVGVPVGVASFLPVRAATHVDVTVSAGGFNRSTLETRDAALVGHAAAEAVGHPRDAGPAPRLPAGPLVVPPPFMKASAYRVQAVEVQGAPGVRVAVSVPMAPRLTPIALYVWISLAAAALLLLAGILAVLAVTNEERSLVPRTLIVAADRIARGDFTARAPPMAGSLGTIATALNRAAEAARAAPAAAPAERTEPSAVVEQPLPPAPAAEEAPPPVAARAEPTPPVQEPAAPQPWGDSAFDPAPAAAPAAPEPPAQSFFEPPSDAPAPPPVPAPPPAPKANGAAPAAREITDDLARAATQTRAIEVPPPAENADEGHWRAVYEEFVRVRAQCAEPEGLSYDRFRQKLQKNRDQLVQKYGCRTVRFQVYVKDGKAALKASPVR